MDKPEDIDYAAAYAEVCKTYHTIDDFRAKLLGFLPAVSGVGALALVGTSGGGVLTALPEVLVFAGVFGALVTVGLFLYEVRGFRHCTFLIHQGKALETALGVQGMGQFTHWDDATALRPMKVADFPRAAQVIYPTVFGAWVFVAGYGLSQLGWDRVPLAWVGLGAAALALVVAWRLTQRASRPEGDPPRNA